MSMSCKNEVLTIVLIMDSEVLGVFMRTFWLTEAAFLIKVVLS